MNRTVRYVIVLMLIGLAVSMLSGCVTAHEAQVKIEILDNTNKHKIDDCLLLAIRMETTEAQGHWWVAQEEKGGHMVPTEARVSTVNTGDMIDQKGKVMVTIGPYVRGRTLGVEYWLYRPGYQPDDFLSDYVERAYEDKITLDIHLLPEDAGSSLSDEKILDGARRVLEVENYLEPCNPDVTRLLTLLIEQVRRVEKESYKPKWQKQSREMLPKLRKALKRFPRVDVTWQNLPAKPANEPKPAAASPAVPPKSPLPKAPVEPREEPMEAAIEEPAEAQAEKQPAASDLPVTETQPTEEEQAEGKEAETEDQPSPELVPVDLSDLDTPSTDTQPAEESESKDDTVESELKPIRKKP